MSGQVKLFNMNLDTGECIAQVDVAWESVPLDEVIANLKEAAEGLTDPTVEIDTEEGYDFTEKYLSVSGKRQMTAAEKDHITKERDVERRRREHMAKFKP